MTEAQEALAKILLKKLDGCWDENGILRNTNIILPDLSKTALKHFKEIIEA